MTIYELPVDKEKAFGVIFEAIDLLEKSKRMRESVEGRDKEIRCLVEKEIESGNPGIGGPVSL